MAACPTTRDRYAVLRRSTPAVLIAAITLSACVERPVDNSPAKVRDENRPVTYEVVLRGDLTLEAKQDSVNVHELSVNDPRFDSARVFSLSSDWVRATRGAVAVMFSFARYRGDGEYQIPPGGGDDRAEGDVSDVMLQFRPGGPDTTMWFFKRISPCRVRIEGSGQAGTLSCTQLADASGREVSLRAAWRN